MQDETSPQIGGGLRRYDVITLFPEMFSALTGSGITRRAIDRGLYALGFHNLRTTCCKCRMVKARAQSND